MSGPRCRKCDLDGLNHFGECEYVLRNDVVAVCADGNGNLRSHSGSNEGAVAVGAMKCKQCNGFGYLVGAPSITSAGGEHFPCGACQPTVSVSLAALANPTPPTIDAPERRAVARLIDPSAWERHDEILLNLEYENASGKMLQRAAADRLVSPSLAKADRILELLAASSGERGAWTMDAGCFSEWPATELAAQCRMQARDNLDPEYSQFMSAIADRILALSGQQGGWQDIATAPKDGTKILLWLPNPRNSAVIRSWDSPEEAWIDDGDGWMTGRNLPTHWMTLPDAPNPATVMSERLSKGDRVQTRFGKGVISDDYRRDRDRFTVQYDDGSESDHGTESITKLHARRTPL